MRGEINKTQNLEIVSQLFEMSRARGDVIHLEKDDSSWNFMKLGFKPFTLIQEVSTNTKTIEFVLAKDAAIISQCRRCKVFKQT